MNNKKQRLFRWALWWGLGITVVSIALLFIPGIDDGQDPVNGMMYNLLNSSFWLMLVVVGIVAPVIEELTFRLWGNGKRWTGIVSSVLMALFMWGTFTWYVGFASLLAGLAFTLFIKDRNRRLLVMMIFSSLLFMVAHTGNYSGNFFATALAVVEKFGFALLASYLVINHNLLWSITMHVLNNSIACIILYFSIAAIKPTTFTSEGQHEITLRPLILDKHTELNYWGDFRGDTLTYNNNLDYIAISLLETEEHGNGRLAGEDTVVFYADSPLHVKYNMQVVFDPTKPYDYAAVVRTLECNGWIKLDTTVEQAYMITIIDSSKSTTEGSLYNDKWMGAYTLQHEGLPILQPEGFKSSEWPVTKPKRDQLKSIDNVRQMLKPYGLDLEPCDQQMTMIRVTTLHDPLAGL